MIDLFHNVVGKWSECHHFITVITWLKLLNYDAIWRWYFHYTETWLKTMWFMNLSMYVLNWGSIEYAINSIKFRRLGHFQTVLPNESAINIEALLLTKRLNLFLLSDIFGTTRIWISSLSIYLISWITWLQPKCIWKKIWALIQYKYIILPV